MGLLTTLLTIYFDSYKMYTKDSEMYKQQEMNQKSVEARVKADQFREQALELMKKHSSTNDLDPLTVLRLIPEDWELKTS